MVKKRRAKARTTKSRKSNPKNNKKSKINGLTKAWGSISTAASGIATLQLITGSGMAASAGQSAPDRVKNFTNVLFGKVTGYAPFKNAAGANTTQTLSIDGMFNKYTAIALGLIGYSMIPVARKYLPHQPKAKSLGKKLLGGALLGGIFSTEGFGQNSHSHNSNLLSNSHTTPMIENVGVIP
jgi:hypothetical protein